MAQRQEVFARLLKRAREEGQVPKKTQESLEWFRTRASKVRDSRNRIFEDRGAKTTKTIEVGQMYFYKYDAKWKEELPFWDAVPLIFPFHQDSKYMWGLNMHLLPPKLRVTLMDNLYALANTARLREKTRLRLSYQAIQKVSKNRYYVPAVRQYLKSHVKTPFYEVKGNEWNIALFLPLQSFRKASSQKVFAEARKQIRKGKRR